jgi:uncharacterized protein (DUF4415 family)
VAWGDNSADIRKTGDAPGKAGLPGEAMKKEYDFTKGKRGAVIPTPGKTRITIRIDDAVLDWFRAQVNKAGGGNYQTMMNEALKRFIATQDGEIEKVLRRVLREELEPYSVKKRPKG